MDLIKVAICHKSKHTVEAHPKILHLTNCIFPQNKSPNVKGLTGTFLRDLCNISSAVNAFIRKQRPWFPSHQP